MRYIILTACLALFIGASCKKNKSKTELEKLPPITQSGANTFGCLINGKAFTPRGNHGKPNFYIIADPGYSGNLHINSYRYNNHEKESISIFCYDIHNSGNFSINGINRIWINYRNENLNCYFLQDNSNFVDGIIKIHKYDFQNGIVSGEFECTLYDSTINCDTIKITNGRFDYKL